MDYNLEFDLAGVPNWEDSMKEFLKSKNVPFVTRPIQSEYIRFQCHASTATQAFQIGCKYVGLLLDMTIAGIVAKNK